MIPIPIYEELEGQTAEQILSSDSQTLGLDKVVSEFIIVDYQEVSKSARHANDVRNHVIRYWINCNGILLLSFGTIAALVGKLQNSWVLLLVLIGCVGIVGTIIAMKLENRAFRYYKALCERGRVIEAMVGVAGQGWWTYEQFVAGNEKDPAHRWLHWVFRGGIVIWVLLPTLFLLSLSLGFDWESILEGLKWKDPIQ